MNKEVDHTQIPEIQRTTENLKELNSKMESVRRELHEIWKTRNKLLDSMLELNLEKEDLEDNLRKILKDLGRDDLFQSIIKELNN